MIVLSNHDKFLFLMTNSKEKFAFISMGFQKLATIILIMVLRMYFNIGS